MKMSYTWDTRKEVLRLFISGQSEKVIADKLDVPERTIRIWIRWYKTVTEVLPDKSKEVSAYDKEIYDKHIEDMVGIAKSLLHGGLESASLYDTGFIVRQLTTNLYNLKNSSNTELIKYFTEHVSIELNKRKTANLESIIMNSSVQLVNSLRLMVLMRHGVVSRILI